MNLPPSSRIPVNVQRWRQNLLSDVQDTLAAEEPLEIRLGYRDPRKGRVNKNVALTMRTPGDDIALALGFLFGESIITALSAVAQTEQRADNVVHIQLHDEVVFDPLRLERNFYTTSSCGVCGKSSLESLSQAGFSALPADNFVIELASLLQLPTQLTQQQALFQLTGGNHATATFDSNGKLGFITEDVGRHNAMDKLIGRSLQAGQVPLAQQGILVSGRASFELLQKALAARASILVAVGAPSSLAVELAQEYNLTLVGFLNDQGFNIYNGGFRIRT